MGLESHDGLELLDDGGEGVGDDGDHDEEGEEQDEDSGHDQLDVPAGHASLLLLLRLLHGTFQTGEDRGNLVEKM